MPLPLQLELILRVLSAALIGSAVGLERGLRKKEAGQRTHCIIAVGACAFTLISVYGFADMTAHVDIGHMAAWIVSGISFLCAGIIYKSDTSGISGLSTATGLWATAALGIACGTGMYALSGCIAAFLIVFHIVLNATHMESFGYTVQNVCIEVDNFDSIHKLLRIKRKTYRARILSCEYTRNEDRNTVTVCFRFRMLGNIPLKDILEFLDTHAEIRSISI